MTSFSEFLAESKRTYLADLAANNAASWTVVMGNEAGDLDTVASSLAYSYLATHLHSRKTIALQQTPRLDLSLRPENIYALEDLAHLNIETDLLCIDDYPEPFNPNVLTKVALVDHNVLVPKFRGTAKVVSIIDHHVDEGQYLEDVPDDERLIVNPVGSSASLVTKHFQPSWTSKTNVKVPPEVATILLSAIYIDTAGLKPGDKGQQIDRDANAFLAPISTFNEGGSFEGPDLDKLAKELGKRKSDVGHLSIRDLLRRDYKQDTFGGLEVGMATVPQGLKAMLEKDDQFWERLDAFLAERTLAVLAVLTTFKSEKKKEKRREMLILVNPSLVTPEVEAKLYAGLEDGKDFELEIKDAFEVQGERHARVWNQKNTDITRKQVAPLIKTILEGSAATK